MIIELGDLMWYVAQACMALEVDFDKVIDRNVKKLEKRYPGVVHLMSIIPRIVKRETCD